MKKQKVRLGQDIDGCIYRWQDTANYLLKTHWGYDLGEWDSWDAAEKVVSRKAWLGLWSEGITKHGLFRYGSIYKGAREYLTRIAEKCDIVVLTSRPPLATLDTLEWLAYQQFPTNEVHIVRDRIGQKKSDILPHCDVYVDDGPKNIQDFIDNTKAIVLLQDRPWNHNETFHCGCAIEDGCNPIRVSSWAEIEKEIDKVYERINR